MRRRRVIVRRLFHLIGAIGGLAGVVLAACQGGGPTAPPIKIGLIAPLSGDLAPSGEAIQRGMLLAIDEINRDGGALGRPLDLVVRDVQNNPAAGVVALQELAQQEIAAVFGGIFSPVMLAQLDAIHELRIPLINPWGSVTAITRNGRNPNYAFRVSVSDEHADEFLVRYVLQVVGARRPAIIADTTAWGESNVAGLTDWLTRLGTAPAGVERFDQGDTNMSRRLGRLQAAGADVLLMVANAPEGAAIVRGLATLGWRPAVVSHWGISGGRFPEIAGVENADGVLTLQTYSFLGRQSPKGEAVLRAYHARFGTRRAEDILAPVGVAHGYDGVHLLARAVRQAGTADGPRVRDALERLAPHDGLVKQYAPAFTPEHHDALIAADYLMAVWQDGRLVPAPRPRLTAD
ncbi:MAG: ABC transporter substrate-binding protein [Chloroflexi bacterium]|nr:ABC transporter substrate-binding protein [Chloroflexota bacterium]